MGRQYHDLCGNDGHSSIDGPHLAKLTDVGASSLINVLPPIG